MESAILCPECREGRLDVRMRALADGRVQCYGVCSCGKRYAGGVIPRASGFDAESAVARRVYP